MAPSQELLSFSFPSVPTTPSSESQTDLSTTTEAPRSSRHRRNHAMSAKRNGMLIFTATPTTNSSIPPLPKMPENIITQHCQPLQVLGSQPLSRSLSDVSSCPTLEADNGPPTPDSIRDLSAEMDYFNFKEIASKAAPSTAATQQGEESKPSQSHEAQPELTDDDDDDEEEFWHCRGLSDPTDTAEEPSLLDARQSKDSDKTESNQLFVSHEDPLECYSDYEDWLQSIAKRTQFFAKMTKTAGLASPSFDYMGLLRYPLLA